jgi:hypothetical protein
MGQERCGTPKWFLFVASNLGCILIEQERKIYMHLGANGPIRMARMNIIGSYHWRGDSIVQPDRSTGSIMYIPLHLVRINRPTDYEFGPWTCLPSVGRRSRPSESGSRFGILPTEARLEELCHMQGWNIAIAATTSSTWEGRKQ